MPGNCERLTDNLATYEAESARSPVPEGFRRDEFFCTVKGRNDDWLGVATALMDTSPQHGNATDMLKHVEWMNETHTRWDASKKCLKTCLDRP